MTSQIAAFIFLAFVFCVVWALVESEFKGNFKEEDDDTDTLADEDNWGKQ